MNNTEAIMVDPPADGEIVNPMDWYDAPGPFEVEIGCGKGGFLLHRAQQHPQVRLLGIEWASKYYRFAADRMARWQLTNVRVMRTDARHFLINHLPPQSVSVLHVYHPDPWPKKRHHKRRLIQPDFVDSVARVLQRGGLWLFQTDHQEYYEFTRSVLDVDAAFERIPWEETGVDPGSEWSGTNFEVKYKREGRSIYRASYRRR